MTPASSQVIKGIRIRKELLLGATSACPFLGALDGQFTKTIATKATKKPSILLVPDDSWYTKMANGTVIRMDIFCITWLMVTPKY